MNREEQLVKRIKELKYLLNLVRLREGPQREIKNKELLAEIEKAIGPPEPLPKRFRSAVRNAYADIDPDYIWHYEAELELYNKKMAELKPNWPEENS